MYFFCTVCNLHHPHFAKNLFYLYMSYPIWDCMNNIVFVQSQSILKEEWISFISLIFLAYTLNVFTEIIQYERDFHCWFFINGEGYKCNNPHYIRRLVIILDNSQQKRHPVIHWITCMNYMHCHRFLMFLTQFNRFLLPQRIQKCSGLFRDIARVNTM